jgi:DNA-binding PadR family transcriptional regulator
MKEKPDVLQGTLALMVLKTLDILGPQHGYGIARRVEQISGDLLAVIRARFYRLTEAGGKQLRAETRDWEQTAAIIARFFNIKAEDLA